MPPLPDDALRDRVELLARSPVLKRASADTLIQIASAGSTAQIEGPDPIYTAGSPAAYALLLVRGTVRLDATITERTVPIGWYRAREIIGDEAVYQVTYRTTAIALSPVMLVRLPARALRAALASDAELNFAWGNEQHRRMVETQLRLGSLGATTHVRLAAFLLNYARRFGAERAGANHIVLDEKPTASQIAAYLGVVRQTVQRDLDKLEALRAIERGSGGGLHLFPEVLARIAGDEGPPSSR
ncbi:Crp/Fnr family transcriptional regulator [Sorangium sp. So ce1014]|uniref:Crp/Fnr family transcriptional regulator n=1 Tax=Sorangium sp. So ce1014 TaxID=3133326 RepID=UPI003F6206E2